MCSTSARPRLNKVRPLLNIFSYKAGNALREECIAVFVMGRRGWGAPRRGGVGLPAERPASSGRRRAFRKASLPRREAIALSAKRPAASGSCRAFCEASLPRREAVAPSAKRRCRFGKLSRFPQSVLPRRGGVGLPAERPASSGRRRAFRKASCRVGKVLSLLQGVPKPGFPAGASRRPAGLPQRLTRAPGRRFSS